MNEKISIIIPVYNLEKYIKRTVESVLKQTYNNIDVIIVDDGSSDKSWKIIQEIAYGNRRIIPIHQKNGGVTNARLNGVRHSTGQWIGFVDGDDTIEPDMYEMLLNNAKRYNADISHCGYQMIFEDGRINYFYNTGCLVQQDRIKGLKDLLEGTFVEPGLCNKLFRKSLFLSLLQPNVMNEHIKNNEDLLMNYILFSKARLSVFEDVCKYHYIVRSNSASRSKISRHKIFDPINVKQIILDRADKQMIPFAQQAYLKTCINTYNVLMLEKINEHLSEKKEIRQIILKHKKWYSLLNKKNQLLLVLICYIPILYPFIYKIYAKLLLHNKYD